VLGPGVAALSPAALHPFPRIRRHLLPAVVRPQASGLLSRGSASFAAVAPQSNHPPSS
jgi:hypothetical protein